LPAAGALASPAEAVGAIRSEAANRSIVIVIEPMRLAGAAVAPSAGASDGKVWLFETPVVDLADPKDTLINPETLVPPQLHAAATGPKL
jgi:hypothetical protein